MASVMAIKSEVYGSCVEGIDVSVEVEYGDVWLWVEIVEVYLGGGSGSRLAEWVGDGARYWMAFWVVLG